MATATGASATAMESAQTLSLSEQALKELLLREVFNAGDLSNKAQTGGGVAQPGNLPSGQQQPPSNAPPASSPPATRDPLVFIKVQPGDLITASFVNGLIDVLHLLDLRVIALEAAEAASTTPAPQG
jgi:hypothetical protein